MPARTKPWRTPRPPFGFQGRLDTYACAPQDGHVSKQNLQRKSCFIDTRALKGAKRLLRVSSDAEAIRVSLDRVAEIERFDRYMEASRGKLPNGSIEHG